MGEVGASKLSKVRIWCVMSRSDEPIEVPQLNYSVQSILLRGASDVFLCCLCIDYYILHIILKTNYVSQVG
jgi:hypothetical protein